MIHFILKQNFDNIQGWNMFMPINIPFYDLCLISSWHKIVILLPRGKIELWTIDFIYYFWSNQSRRFNNQNDMSWAQLNCPIKRYYKIKFW